MKVTWKDDLRPMPDQVPAAYDEACWDTRLIIERYGQVVGQHRSLFGVWYFLVFCDDGELREVTASKITVVSNKPD